MVGVIEQACVYSAEVKKKNSKHLKIYLKISFCLWGYLPKVWKEVVFSATYYEYFQSFIMAFIPTWVTGSGRFLQFKYHRCSNN